jgi:hypothetical protein
MSKIRTDDELKSSLANQGYKLDDILEKKEKIFVRKNCNLST